MHITTAHLYAYDFILQLGNYVEHFVIDHTFDVVQKREVLRTLSPFNFVVSCDNASWELRWQ